MGEGEGGKEWVRGGGKGGGGGGRVGKDKSTKHHKRSPRPPTTEPLKGVKYGTIR